MNVRRISARVGGIPGIPGVRRIEERKRECVCPVYRALLRSTYGKNFRVDCLVFRISERPRVLFPRHDTRITYIALSIRRHGWRRDEEQ